MAQSDSQVSLEELALMVQTMAMQVDLLSQQAVLQGGTPGVNQSSAGITLLQVPVSVVTGTTSAVTTWTTASLGNIVPRQAKGVLLWGQVQLSGAGSMRIHARGAAWTEMYVTQTAAASDYACGSVWVPVSAQQIQYKVTDAADGGVTANWQAYDLKVLGWI